MSLNVDPVNWSRLQHGDETSWIDFAGHHALQHNIFDVAIRRAGGLPYPVLPIGTSSRSDWLMGEQQRDLAFYPDEDWHSAHQVMHDGMAASLLIASPSDFRSYDFTDTDEFSSWAFLHALEHTRIRQAIGI